MLLSDKRNQILAILGDGQFHSGTKLAQTLGVSRAAVWKQIQLLSELGLTYSAISGKGYKLDQPLELLSEQQILAELSEYAKSNLSALEIHQQIDSTNRYALEQAQHQRELSGLVVLAERQTAGRGRRGRHWVSPFGSNIYLSILWRFQLGYSGTAGLSLAIGVAVIRALREQAITGVGLKWPNDVYYQGRKLGGILIEIAGETDGPCAAVIGLGLNGYLSETEAQGINQAWTDLSKITGNTICRNRLAAVLITHLFRVLAEFEQCGVQAYAAEWRRYDELFNQYAKLLIAGQPYPGILRGIDDNGYLLLEHSDGRIQAYASGEVSFNPEFAQD